MGVRELFASGPGTGKTTSCIALFKESLLKTRAGIDSRSYFVLPSREHADRIRNLIIRKDLPGLFNAHVLTFRDLSARLLADAEMTPPSDSVRRRLVAEALEARDAAGESLYRYFRDSLSFRGFRDLALSTLKEFKSGLLSVAEFERRANAAGLLKDELFLAKYRDVSIFLKRYDERLAELGLTEPDDRIAGLGPDSIGEPLDLVIFDGFYHFTKSQRRVLEWVAGAAKHTVVTLTVDEGPGREALFEYPNRTRRFLTESGFRERPAGKANLRAAQPALAYLADKVFSGESSSQASGAGVTVLRAPSRRVEYEMIAREIRRLHREEPYHYSDICLILRSVSGERALIESVFHEYGLPVSIHERGKLSESGLMEALRRWLQLSLDGWKREDVAYLAKSSYFRSELSLEDAIALESAAIRANLREGREGWLALKDAPPAGAKFVARLARGLDAVGAAKSARSFGRAVKEFTEPLYDETADTEGVDRAGRRALEAFLSSARRQGGSFSAALLAQELAEAVQQGLFSLKRPGRNRVQVYDAVMALPKEFKVVFVCGLVEKTFPRAVVEDALFKDDERRALNGADPVLEERLSRASGERYFFFMAVSRARERLYLTHTTHDEDGRPELASFFLDEAMKCFTPGSVRILEKELSDFLPGPFEWETENDLARGLAAMEAPARPADLLKPSVVPALFLRAAEYAARAGAAPALSAGALGELKRFPSTFSASSLEAFLTCAFRFYAEHLLKLEAPLEERDEADKGTLLHEVLHKYFSELDETSRRAGAYRRDAGRLASELHVILDTQFEKWFPAHPAYRRAAYKEELRRFLKRFAELESKGGGGFVPTYFEAGFGERQSLGAFRLGGGEDAVALKGFIDRVDVNDAGEAVVIDYKRSRRGLAKKSQKGLEVQMGLYALAVKRLLGLKPAGAFHRVLREGKDDALFYAKSAFAGKRNTLEAEEIEALLAEYETKILDAVRSVRSGEMSVKPKSCEFCDYDAVCRIESRKGRAY